VGGADEAVFLCNENQLDYNTYHPILNSSLLLIAMRTLNLIVVIIFECTNPTISQKNTALSTKNHSFSSLSYDRSKVSSKASSPHSAIQSFLF
jgi:hypothetical protein